MYIYYSNYSIDCRSIKKGMGVINEHFYIIMYMTVNVTFIYTNISAFSGVIDARFFVITLSHVEKTLS